MTEILTESFCERCGTRYTFESAAPGQRRFSGLKVLGLGLKQFVLSDDASLDESIAAARSDLERDATNLQLDAFHKTFSFCMSCRQYTCANCWNGPEVRCLTCAPLAIAEPEIAADGGIDADRLFRVMSGTGQNAEPSDHEHVHVFQGDGSADGIADASAEAAVDAESWPAADTITADVHVDASDLERTDVPEPEPLAEPLPDLSTGQSLEDAIAAFEATVDETAASEPVPEPIATIADADAGPIPAAAEPDAAAAAEPDAAAAEVGTDAESVPAAETVEELLAAPDVAAVAELAPDATAEPPSPTVEPVALPESAPAPESAPTPPAVAPTPPAVDTVPQPVWPTPPATQAPPQWPTGPRWPTGIPTQSAGSSSAAPVAQAGSTHVDPLAALIARNSTNAMWDASSQEILRPAPAVPAVTGVHGCTNCGISLSATARFCRRCGTPQG